MQSYKIDGKLSPIFLQGVDNDSLDQMQDQLRDGDSALPTLRFDKPPFDGERVQKYHTWSIVAVLISLYEQKAAFRMCSLVRAFPVEGKCLDGSWKSVGDCRRALPLHNLISVFCLIPRPSSHSQRCTIKGRMSKGDGGLQNTSCQTTLFGACFHSSCEN